MRRRAKRQPVLPIDPFIVVWNGTQAKQGTAEVSLASSVLFVSSPLVQEASFPRTLPSDWIGIKEI